MLRDRLHPIHQNITILPGGEGFLAALFHYRNDETKFRTSVGKWLLDPSNIEKMKRPIIICPMNEHQSHWICLVLFNPLCCQQPQDEMFSGYIIYDSMGNNCFENDKSEHLLVLQKLLHMTHEKIYETDEQLDYLKELLDPNKFSPLFLESRTGHQNAPDAEQFNTVLKQNDTHSCGIMVILFCMEVMLIFWQKDKDHLKPKQETRSNKTCYVIKQCDYPFGDIWLNLTPKELQPKTMNEWKRYSTTIAKIWSDGCQLVLARLIMKDVFFITRKLFAIWL